MDNEHLLSPQTVENHMNCPLTPIIHGRDAKAAAEYKFIRWFLRSWWRSYGNTVQHQVAGKLRNTILHGTSQKPGKP